MPPHAATVVYVGPSLATAVVRAALPAADVRPPAARGDLVAAVREGATDLILIDGLFGHQLAVAPSEVVAALQCGARIVGASSMGALRAADCWPAGMTGVGAVYRLFRAGIFSSDDEVAIAVDADSGYAAISLALVNIRFSVLAHLRRGTLDRSQATDILRAARETHFAERSWRGVLRDAGIPAQSRLAKSLASGPDIKASDAVRALEFAANLAPHDRDTRAAVEVRATSSRYPGHDRFLGQNPATLRVPTLRWIFGSGRYQRYLWALVAGEPEFDALPDDLTRRAGEIRERLAACLTRLLVNESVTADRLWRELEYCDELDAEVMRMEAARSAPQVHVDHVALTGSRQTCAVAHGYGDWAALRADRDESGRLFGAIPFVWVSDAAHAIARLRSLSV